MRPATTTLLAACVFIASSVHAQFGDPPELRSAIQLTGGNTTLNYTGFLVGTPLANMTGTLQISGLSFERSGLWNWFCTAGNYSFTESGTSDEPLIDAGHKTTTYSITGSGTLVSSSPTSGATYLSLYQFGLPGTPHSGNLTLVFSGTRTVITQETFYHLSPPRTVVGAPVTTNDAGVPSLIPYIFGTGTANSFTETLSFPYQGATVQLQFSTERITLESKDPVAPVLPKNPVMQPNVLTALKHVPSGIDNTWTMRQDSVILVEIHGSTATANTDYVAFVNGVDGSGYHPGDKHTSYRLHGWLRKYEDGFSGWPKNKFQSGYVPVGTDFLSIFSNGLKVTSDSSGVARFYYGASELSGQEKIDVTLFKSFDGYSNADLTVTLRVPTLAPLTSGPNIDLIGNTSAPGTNHPENHWGQPGLIQAIQALAANYRNEHDRPSHGLPARVNLGVNDMSLPEGGKFDIDGNWVGYSDGVAGVRHQNHRLGFEVDLDITGNNQKANQLIEEQGWFRKFLEGNHYHLVWDSTLAGRVVIAPVPENLGLGPIPLVAVANGGSLGTYDYYSLAIPLENRGSLPATGVYVTGIIASSGVDAVYSGSGTIATLGSLAIRESKVANIQIKVPRGLTKFFVQDLFGFAPDGTGYNHYFPAKVGMQWRVVTCVPAGSASIAQVAPGIGEAGNPRSSAGAPTIGTSAVGESKTVGTGDGGKVANAQSAAPISIEFLPGSITINPAPGVPQVIQARIINGTGAPLEIGTLTFDVEIPMPRSAYQVTLAAQFANTGGVIPPVGYEGPLLEINWLQVPRANTKGTGTMELIPPGASGLASVTGTFALSYLPMDLLITRSGSELIISWPAIEPGWVLVGSPDLGASGWEDINAPVVQSGGRYSVTVEATGLEKWFFRLEAR